MAENNAKHKFSEIKVSERKSKSLPRLVGLTPKITRYNGDLAAFASAASVGNRFVFGTMSASNDLTTNINSNFLAGWEDGLDINGYPTEQWFNAVSFTNGQLLAYLHQVGMAEYNAAQSYYIGSYCNYNGVLYASQTDSNVGNTPSSNPSQWRSVGASGLAWDTTQTYNAGDFVSYAGVLYASLIANNSANIPSSSPSAWNSIYNSPALTGIPTAPTATAGTNTTQIATTAFVANAAGFATGDIKHSLSASPIAGWLVWQNGSIGNAGSAATLLADASALALFTLIWNNTTQGNCPVMPSGVRGASAMDDFTALQSIGLPNVDGNTLVNLVGSYALGATFGEASNTLTSGQQANMPVSATITGSGSGVVTTTVYDTAGNVGGLGSGDGNNGAVRPNPTVSVTSITGTATGTATGGGAPVENRQPSTAVYMHIKL
jgi:hypothetical protein